MALETLVIIAAPHVLLCCSEHVIAHFKLAWVSIITLASWHAASSCILRVFVDLRWRYQTINIHSQIGIHLNVTNSTPFALLALLGISHLH